MPTHPGLVIVGTVLIALGAHCLIAPSIDWSKVPWAERWERTQKVYGPYMAAYLSYFLGVIFLGAGAYLAFA